MLERKSGRVGGSGTFQAGCRGFESRPPLRVESDRPIRDINPSARSRHAPATLTPRSRDTFVRRVRPRDTRRCAFQHASADQGHAPLSGDRFRAGLFPGNRAPLPPTPGAVRGVHGLRADPWRLHAGHRSALLAAPATALMVGQSARPAGDGRAESLDGPTSRTDVAELDSDQAVGRSGAKLRPNARQSARTPRSQ